MKTYLRSTVRSLKTSTTAALALLAVASAGVAHDHAHADRSSHRPAATTPAHAGGASHVAAKLPPLPADVTEIKFGDFFVRPVGTRGLEVTDQLRQLDGRRAPDRVHHRRGESIMTPKGGALAAGSETVILGKAHVAESSARFGLFAPCGRPPRLPTLLTNVRWTAAPRRRSREGT